jgi:hypothetical protein
MESGDSPVTQSYDQTGGKGYNPRRSKAVKLKPRRPAAAPSGSSSDDAGIDLDKPIFTLSVASEILETHPRTLMMYEHLDMIRPKRTVTNRRRYSRRDIMKLQAIQTLTRHHGVNLAGVRYILVLLKRLQAAGIEPPEGLRNLDVTLIDV